jgi:hypothetical protein
MAEIHINEQLMRIGNQDEVFEFLLKPAAAIAAGVAVMLGDPGRLALMSGRIVQAALKKDLFNQLGKEIKQLTEEGEIKENFFATHNQKSTLNDFLKFIDDNPPDEEVFRAMKSIFFCSIDVTASAIEERTAHQFLQICKNLGSGEILLLKECWAMKDESPSRLAKLRDNTGPLTTSEWFEIMGKKLRLPAGLIAVYAEKLRELNLLAEESDGAVTSQLGRLSSFGLELGSLITRH